MEDILKYLFRKDAIYSKDAINLLNMSRMYIVRSGKGFSNVLKIYATF